MNTEAALSSVRETLTARRVFGEPIVSGDLTLIPVARVHGGGGGNDRGAGFGVNAEPAGMFVVRNGDVRWRPAINVNRIVLGGQIVAMTALLTIGPVLKAWVRNRQGR